MHQHEAGRRDRFLVVPVCVMRLFWIMFSAMVYRLVQNTSPSACSVFVGIFS